MRNRKSHQGLFWLVTGIILVIITVAYKSGDDETLIVSERYTSEKSQTTKEDYISACRKLNYTDILRNPSTYKETKCMVSGNVDHVIEGIFGGYTIYVNDSDGNKWECNYKYKDEESHILEGDHVIFYGVCNGTTTATTLFGKQVIFPEIDVKYRK